MPCSAIADLQKCPLLYYYGRADQSILHCHAALILPTSGRHGGKAPNPGKLPNLRLTENVERAHQESMPPPSQEKRGRKIPDLILTCSNTLSFAFEVFQSGGSVSLPSLIECQEGTKTSRLVICH